MPMKAKHREAAWSLTEAVIVGIAALVTGGEALPSYRGIYRLLRKEIHREFEARRIPQAVRRAESRGFIRITRVRHEFRIQVTEKGHQLLTRRALEGAAAKRPKRWDGRWRVLVFDVPEKRRRDRDVLRKTLRRLGFYHLQHSVWVYPFDCKTLIATMRAAYDFSHITVRHILAKEIEDDAALRLHFDI